MAPQYLSPGVYIEDVPGVARFIPGVPTTVAVFIGNAKKGAFNKAQCVQSFSEFESAFGGLQGDAELGYAVGQFFLNGGMAAWIVRTRRSARRANMTRALRSLDEVELFNLMAIPAMANPEILFMAADYCKERRAFLIVDAPSTARTPAEMLQVIKTGGVPRKNHAAVYFPWIRIRDHLSGTLRSSAPSGTIAGLIAVNDRQRGVWKAPAGTNAILKGVEDLEYTLSDLEIDELHQKAVNTLRVLPGRNMVAWGARTLESNGTSEWKYIPVKRLALFMEECIHRGTKWAVFEPNDEKLWTALRATVSGFLQGLFRQGAFQGQTPEQAYFVKCDRETTTQNDIQNGLVNITFGFAAIKPAEFVIIQIQQRAAEM